MGLEKIRQAVLTEAKNEAVRILDRAKKRNGNFLKLQRQETEQKADRLCKVRMQAIEEEYHRELIQLEGRARKQILDKRNTLLKSIFEKAKGEILSWPPERYAERMRCLIEKVAGKAGGKIRVHPEERDLFRRVLAELNEGREDGKITLDQSAPLPERGGFLFVGTYFEVDQTLDTVLKEIEHDMLPAIAADLFSEP
jgi:V/A-type H+-transporting ATPase subunit E